MRLYTRWATASGVPLPPDVKRVFRRMSIICRLNALAVCRLPYLLPNLMVFDRETTQVLRVSRAIITVKMRDDVLQSVTKGCARGPEFAYSWFQPSAEILASKPAETRMVS